MLVRRKSEELKQFRQVARELGDIELTLEALILDVQRAMKVLAALAQGSSSEYAQRMDADTEEPTTLQSPDTGEGSASDAQTSQPESP